MGMQENCPSLPVRGHMQKSNEVPNGRTWFCNRSIHGTSRARRAVRRYCWNAQPRSLGCARLVVSLIAEASSSEEVGAMALMQQRGVVAETQTQPRTGGRASGGGLGGGEK